MSTLNMGKDRNNKFDLASLLPINQSLACQSFFCLNFSHSSTIFLVWEYAINTFKKETIKMDNNNKNSNKKGNNATVETTVETATVETAVETIYDRYKKTAKEISNMPTDKTDINALKEIFNGKSLNYIAGNRVYHLSDRKVINTKGSVRLQFTEYNEKGEELTVRTYTRRVDKFNQISYSEPMIATINEVKKEAKDIIQLSTGRNELKSKEDYRLAIEIMKGNLLTLATKYNGTFADEDKQVENLNAFNNGLNCFMNKINKI